MNMLLDQRRRSMLKAMGLELWWSPNAPVPAPAQVSTSPSPQESVAFPAAPVPLVGNRADTAPAVPAVERPAAQAEPQARTVQPAATEAAASTAAQARTGSARTRPSSGVQWQCQPAAPVFADSSPLPDTAAGLPNWLFITDDFGGMGDDSLAAEQLFHNMLRAMRLARQPNVWFSQMQQLAQQPEAAGAQHAGGASLEELVQITQPKVIVLMGRIAAQTLLESSQPLGVLRQASHVRCQTPVVATYSPSYLLRASHAKAGAWADLRRALQIAHG